jgi:hypothetical protein
MTSEIPWKMILTAIEIIVGGTVLIMILSAFTKQTCQQQFTYDIHDLINTACRAQPSDEPIEKTLDLRDCIEYVTYEDRKLNYKVVSKENPEEPLSTECPEENPEEPTNDYVEFIGFIPGNPPRVFRDNMLKYEITIEYRKIILGTCCSDCTCDNKNLCEFCTNNEINQCYFWEAGRQCVQRDNIQCSEGGPEMLCVEAANYFCGLEGKETISSGCMIDKCVIECGDCNEIEASGGFDAFPDYMTCIKSRCPNLPYDSDQCCVKVNSCNDYPTYSTCIQNKCYDKLGICEWDYETSSCESSPSLTTTTLDCCADCSCSNKNSCEFCTNNGINTNCFFDEGINRCRSVAEPIECNIPFHCIYYCKAVCNGEFSKCNCEINKCIVECNCVDINSCDDYKDEFSCEQDGCEVAENYCNWDFTNNRCYE